MTEADSCCGKNGDDDDDDKDDYDDDKNEVLCYVLVKFILAG